MALTQQSVEIILELAPHPQWMRCKDVDAGVFFCNWQNYTCVFRFEEKICALLRRGNVVLRRAQPNPVPCPATETQKKLLVPPQNYFFYVPRHLRRDALKTTGLIGLGWVGLS